MKKLNVGEESNKFYEVRVYDKDGNLKETIPPNKVKELSWKNFKGQTNWKKKVSNEYKVYKAQTESEDKEYDEE